MTLLAAWVAFPLLLGVLAYGCGAVVEFASARPLSLAVRLPCGAALMIVVLDVLTRSTATVPAAVPVLVVLAASGLLARRVWRIRHLDAAIGPALVVFVVYAAPIMMSGSATWAGYVKLDDTANWVALAQRVLAVGHTFSGVQPISTYYAALSMYLTNGYPVGSFLPMGLGHYLLGQDTAWMPDPWMAFMAAMLALSLERLALLALGARARDWRTFLVAILAAASALLYGYYLWGAIKELAAAMLLAAFASVAPLALEGERRVRASIPTLVVLGAMLSALSAGGMVWVLPGALIAAAALSLPRLSGLLRRLRKLALSVPARSTALAVSGVLAACGLAAYLALRPGGFVEKYKGALTASTELGNLIGPLHLQQITGVWLSGDFRTLPSSLTATNILVAVVAVLGAGGALAAVARGRRAPVLYGACALAGALLVYFIGSPWVGGKALATASPAVAFLALVGCAMLLGGSHRALGLIAGLAVATGIVWSDVLAYHDALFAPHEQMVELAEIGERIAGQGPTLMTSYSTYGTRYFLRDAEPESAEGELRRRADQLVSGQELTKGEHASIDQFQLPSILEYRTLVLRRSPFESRPPSPYKLILRDEYWDVWQRPAGVSVSVLAQKWFGGNLAPGGVPSCAEVTALARTPGAQRLAAQPTENPLVFHLGEEPHPRRWASGQREYVNLATTGTQRIELTISHAGLYQFWLGGSFAGPVSISVSDGRHTVGLGSAMYELALDGQYVPFGEVELDPGEYTVAIHYDRGEWWRPGSGGPPASVGPLVVQHQVAEPRQILVPVARARSLCGRTLAWVEALAG